MNSQTEPTKTGRPAMPPGEKMIPVPVGPTQAQPGQGMTYNTEFKEAGEWHAQHTGLTDQGDAIEKAKSLFKWKRESLESRFGGVRITEGQPFGKVVATCNRVGAVRWPAA